MKYLNNKIVTANEITLELTASNSYEGNTIFTSANKYFEQTGEVEAKENDGEIVDEFFNEQTRINALHGYLIIENKAQIYSGQSVIDNEAIEYTIGKEPDKLVNGLAYRTLQEVIDDKNNEINSKYTVAILGIKKGYTEDEVLTFNKQESEAKAWILDNAVVTPFLDGLVTAREIDKSELVDRIITKANAFATLGGKYTGTRQKYEDIFNNIKLNLDAEDIDEQTARNEINTIDVVY